VINGHDHFRSSMLCWYSPCIIEGRGGAGVDIGYTLIYVSPEGIFDRSFLA